MKKRMVLGLLLALMVALSACSSGNETVPAEGTAMTLNEEYPNAVSVSSQIAIGTLMLEDTTCSRAVLPLRRSLMLSPVRFRPQ